MTKIIGIDCDNVLQEFSPIWNKYIASLGLRNFDELSPAESWNFYLNQGFTHDDFISICNQGVDDGVIFYDGPPMQGSAEALRRLKDLGCVVYIITDRHFGSEKTTAQELTKKWLAEYEIPYDGIFFSGDKTSVYTDYMCDDLIGNYDALEETDCTPYLYTWPWNIDDGSRRRVSDLNDFVDIIEREIKSEQTR